MEAECDSKNESILKEAVDARTARTEVSFSSRLGVRLAARFTCPVGKRVGSQGDEAKLPRTRIDVDRISHFDSMLHGAHAFLRQDFAQARVECGECLRTPCCIETWIQAVAAERLADDRAVVGRDRLAAGGNREWRNLQFTACLSRGEDLQRIRVAAAAENDSLSDDLRQRAVHAREVRKSAQRSQKSKPCFM